MTTTEDVLAAVRETAALELDQAARCAVCGHRGRDHGSTGCEVVDEPVRCACRVPVRLVRCVVVHRDCSRYVFTAAALATLDALVDPSRPTWQRPPTDTSLSPAALLTLDRLAADLELRS